MNSAREILYMEKDWRNHIVSTPDTLCGKPRIKGTRLSVGLILGYLASGSSPEEIMREYDGLKQEEIVACLQYARDLVDSEFARQKRRASRKT